MGLFDRMFKRKPDFFDMLQEQMQLTLQGIEALEKYFHTGSEEAGNEVVRLEREADEVRRIIIDELNRTFITPIEREDIFSLSRNVDDIIDYCKSTLQEMKIFKLSADDNVKAIADLLKGASTKLNYALARLKNHPGVASEHCAKAKSLINEVEPIYYQSLAQLAENPDFSYIFKMREVYRQLYHLGDRIDESANILTDIIVKMT